MEKEKQEMEMEIKMEVLSPESDPSEIKQQQVPIKRKGGLITVPFIIANESLERVASFGLTPNMIMYLIKEYKMPVLRGTNMLFIWSSVSNFTPLIGAFLSDSFLGRFLTVGLGSVFNLLGMVLLWLTAMIPKARSSHCNQLGEECKSATPGQLGMLISAFALMSIGAGGIRPCALTFGADQFDNRTDPNNAKVLERFFSWFYLSSGVSVLIAFTGIVYIQDHLGWKIGFGIPAFLMFLSVVFFFLASPLYIKLKPTRSLFTGFAKVAVAAFKNRQISFPPQNSDGWHHLRDSTQTVPTNRLRFLNKACIIRNPADITQDGVASNPWRLCTVEQVEELKALIRVIPIWSSGIMVSINFSQGAFPLLQARSMNRHLTSGFQIPAGSFGTFTIIVITVWIILYDRVILPLASKLKGKPVHLGVKTRMAIGLFFSGVSMIASAIVEHVRRRKAVQEGFQNHPEGVLKMSAMWLLLHNLFSGLGEAFYVIGQSEFYYSEFPKSMSSLGSALAGLAGAVAGFLATALLSTVNRVTSRGNNEGWIADNINRGHYDYYYWLLAVMSFINLLYFIACSWAYGPTAADQLAKTKKADKQLSELENGFRNGGAQRRTEEDNVAAI